jgi:hypothetical protein
MSRRSRRRQGNAGGAGWLARTAIGLIVICLLAAAVLYAAVYGYLHSDAFRRLLSEKVSAAARVTGEFAPFRWDGLAVETAVFEATGEGAIRQMRLDGLHTEVGVGGLRRGVWELRDARARRIELSLDARNSAEKIMPPAEMNRSPSGEGKSDKQGWLPKEVELQGLELREVALNARFDQGLATVSGMRAGVQPAGAKRAYRVEIADGRIRLPFRELPEIRMQRARLRCQEGAVFLSSATAAAWKDGRIEATGGWDATTRQFSIEGNVSGVKCEELFNEDWAKRLIGEMGSDFSANNHAGKPVAQGLLTVRNGTITALPVLDALAAYADTRRFRMLALSEAHATWRWEKGVIDLTDIVLACEGLVRLEGRASIRGRDLDGMFRLGLAPGTLATIPGAETHVFSPGERGMLWTPLRLTGTIDDPKEDLTDRLIVAAGLRMLETLPESGEKVLKFTRKALGEESSKTVEKGVKIIGESGKTVRGVSDILDSLLGSGKRRDEPEPEKDGVEP